MITKLQVKYIQSLGQKKFRDEAGEFIAEGPKIINELLGSDHILPAAVYATKEYIEEHAPVLQKVPGGKIHELKPGELERLSFLATPHGVLGIFKKPLLPVSVLLKKSILLMLDGIQDPGNMGTLIRTADWFGVQQVICGTDCADAFAPKVVQASMGSIARVQLLYTDLHAFINEHKDVRLYATTLTGKPLSGFEKLKEGVIIIGNESKGISKQLLDASHEQVTIPRTGRAESLNAAVAAGILLSHLVGL